MIRSKVAINLCSQRRASLVTNQHRNLGVCQPALAALRHEVAPQPVRRDMRDVRRFARRRNPLCALVQCCKAVLYPFKAEIVAQKWLRENLIRFIFERLEIAKQL